ncbi:uncharacterized protein LOC105831105 [Monomorium pharaonis]|uniref:uncharacterized protein LOC105831105 n=1 Tax=Monomorium pharaonis TaxID=307658 RepID=UPI00063ED52A|nr:uncharacterized protein LOC105831105 [Monomorium pharaonis]
MILARKRASERVPRSPIKESAREFTTRLDSINVRRNDSRKIFEAVVRNIYASSYLHGKLQEVRRFGRSRDKNGPVSSTGRQICRIQPKMVKTYRIETFPLEISRDPTSPCGHHRKRVPKTYVNARTHEISPKAYGGLQGKTDFPESLFDRDSYEEKLARRPVKVEDQEYRRWTSSSISRTPLRRIVPSARSTARDSFARECALSLSRGAVKIGVFPSLSQAHARKRDVVHRRRSAALAFAIRERPGVVGDGVRREVRISRQKRSSASSTRRRLRVKNGQ